MASEFDQILDDLESRWNHSTEVELAVFLSEHGIVGQKQDSPPETIRLLLEAVQVDLERRWMSRGRLPIPVIAQYLEQFPSLNTADARAQLEAFDRTLRQRWPQSEFNDTPQLARTSLAVGEPPNEEFGPRRSDFSDGQKFGPYRIVRKIGEGGMGAVYEAVQEHLGKSVAIKVLSPKLVHDDDVVARFRREMKAAGQIEHPHVVRAMDAGEIDGTHYLVTEFVDGTDLSKLVQTNGPVSVRDACHIISQAAEALSAAHAQGFIHRDIKPSNLMLTAGGKVKLLDLGLTRLVSDNESLTTELTEAGNTFGTPDYMAPEQWEDAREADPRTDLYALGCTLFFLLIGRAPYAIDRYRSAYNKMKAHSDAEIPDATSLREDIPAELAAVIRKLLAKRREDRFQTAAELSLAIATIQTGVLSDTEPQIAKPGFAKTPVPQAWRSRLALSLIAISIVVVAGLALHRVFNTEKPNNASYSDVLPGITSGERPPAKSHSVAAESNLDPDRAVAEWVLQSGGQIKLLNQGNFIEKVADLPATPITVVRVVIRNVPDFTEADARRLTTLRELMAVSFVQTTLAPGAIQALAECRPLQSLHVVFGSAAVTTLAESLLIPQLRNLDFHGVALTDELFARLGQLRQLLNLQIYACTGVTEEGLVRLAAAPPPKLQTITLNGLQLRPKGMKAIASLPHLNSLDIGQTQLDDAALLELIHCPSLTSVNLRSEPGVTQAATTELQRALANCQMCVASPEQAPPLNTTVAYRDTIRQLMAQGFSINVYTDAVQFQTWISSDDPFPKGEVVFAAAVSTARSQSGSQVPEERADLQRIAQLPDLRAVTLGMLPPDGLGELLPLKNLSELWITTGVLTEAEVALLPSFSKLTDLKAKIPSDAALTTIAKLPHLSRLTFHHESQYTAAGLKALETAATLSQVDLGYSNISSEAAQSFANARPDVIVLHRGERINPIGSNLAPQAVPSKIKPSAPIPASSALEFDGLDDRVDIPSFKFDWSKPFTWDAIVEPLPDKVRLSEDKSAFADPLFRHTNQDLSGFNILLDRVASHWFLIHRPSVSSPYNYYSAPCRSTGTPRHLAVVFTGEELSLYEDGNKQPLKHLSELKGAADSQQVDLKTYSNSSGSLGQDIYYAKNISRWFRGRFRHLQLSEGARDPKGFTQDTGDTVANSTTALLYQFERHDGEQLRDLSPHQRHGWIRGARWVSLTKDNREPETQTEPSIPTAAQAEASACVRQLVHSVVSAGGRVEIQFDSQHGFVLVNRDNLADLPERPFLVRTIVLADATQWPEEQQELLGDVPYLDWIRLDQASTATLDILSKMALKGAFVIGSDPELRILRNRGIQELSLMGNLGDETAWNQLAELPRLDRLVIGSASRPSIQVLPRCPSLRNLTLSFPEPVPDDLLQTLASLLHLTELKIEGPVGDNLLHVVEPLKRLKVLDVSAASKVTGGGLQQLVAARPDLIVLHPTLRATEADLATRKFIEAARGTLQVNTSNGQAWKAESSEPFVPRELHFQGGRLTDFAQALRDLRYLSTVRCPSTGNPDELANLFKLQPSLRVITLEARGMTADGLRELAAQPELLQIEMHSSPKLSGEEWSPIANCRRLRRVTFLDGTEIGDDVLAHLARCEQLDTLVIQNSPYLTPSGLLPLKSLPWLVELNLARCSLDDSAVDNLTQLQSLRVLHLDGTRVTQLGIDRLRAALPKCAIFWKGTVLLPTVRREP